MKLKKKPSKCPASWGKLKGKREFEVLREMVTQFPLLNRWPTAQELSIVLKRSQSSIRRSLEVLLRDGFLKQTAKRKRGVPPVYAVDGMRVTLTPSPD